MLEQNQAMILKGHYWLKTANANPKRPEFSEDVRDFCN
jgi:hypothetical protein